MKIKAYLLVLTCCGLVCLPHIAADIPVGVSPEMGTVSGWYEYEDGARYMVVKNNWAVAPWEVEQYYDGKWDIYVPGYKYELTFWNVGELGAYSGKAWQSNKYRYATLRIDYSAVDPGKVWKRYVVDDHEFWKIENATSEPNLEPITYNLVFTGGPQGYFVEHWPFVSTWPVYGNIIYPSHVILHFPDPPYVLKDGVKLPISGVPLTIQGNPFFGWNPLDGADSGARFSDFSGEVVCWHHGQYGDEFPADFDVVLQIGDHVKTETDSSCILSFADMTTFCMRELSEIYFESPPFKQGKIDIIAGKIWTNVKRMLEGGSMEVTMNQAVCGIKGTTFICEEQNGTSTVKVINGSVEVTATADGSTATLAAGEMVSATETGLGAVLTFDVENETILWSALLPDEKQEGADGGGGIPGFEVVGILGAVALLVFSRRKKPRP
jgi:hypothetical protein